MRPLWITLKACVRLFCAFLTTSRRTCGSRSSEWWLDRAGWKSWCWTTPDSEGDIMKPAHQFSVTILLPYSLYLIPGTHKKYINYLCHKSIKRIKLMSVCLSIRGCRVCDVEAEGARSLWRFLSFSDFAQKLASALSHNPASTLHTINLSNNSLEDKG